MGGGAKAPQMRSPAPKVRESISDQQGVSAAERDKAKKRRGYAATKDTKTLLGGGQETGSKTLLG